MSDTAANPNRRCLIADLPETERPRERLIAKGAESLSIVELLAIILRTGARGQSSLDLASTLLQHFGTLSELAAATPAELAQFHGIGNAKAADLKAVFALAARMADDIRIRSAAGSPRAAAAYFRSHLQDRRQEELWALLLDTKNRVIRKVQITVGLLDRSHVHAREVFRAAVHHSAAKIILAHNHPSGDPTASAHDIRCTHDLVKAGRIIGIDVVDHIIIGDAATPERDYISLRETGVISAPARRS